MKAITLFTFLIICVTGNSQLLKRVLNDAKNEAEWKVRSKAKQKTNEAMDSLLTAPKKEDKKSKKQSKAKQQEASQSASENVEDGMSIGEGFIKLSVSANEVFKGGTIAITGTSVKYGNLTDVKMSVSGPGVNETKSLKLFENGSFTTSWQPDKSGEFIITVASSDDKDRRSAKVTVIDMEVWDDWTKENKDETRNAYELVNRMISKIQPGIGQTDKAELDKKMKQFEQDVETAQEFFDELNNAVKELRRSKTTLPASLRTNLSQLNDALFEHLTQTKKLREIADHEPYDNTICEYIVMVNEACAAFSTFTNLGKVAVTILTKIIMDKTPLGQMTNSQSSPNNYAGAAKIPAVLFARSKLDAEQITAGRFTADVMEYVTSFLLKKYCGIIKGTLDHDYQIVYRNKVGTTWWKYDYKTAAAITLRYPKNNAGGKIIKMKGCIEGNATRFNFYQDVEQMDDFKEQMQGRTKLTPIEIHKPTTVSVSTTQYSGLGAVARGMGTPAYFYIPVDAEYDTEANTITLILNDPLIDFSALVNYTYGYIGIAAGIPLVTRVTFPINKAKLTLNAVMSRNNELEVNKDAKNNLIIKGAGERHIGSETSEIEHKINFSLTAKNDN